MPLEEETALHFASGCIELQLSCMICQVGLASNHSLASCHSLAEWTQCGTCFHGAGFLLFVKYAYTPGIPLSEYIAGFSEVISEVDVRTMIRGHLGFDAFLQMLISGPT